LIKDIKPNEARTPYILINNYAKQGILLCNVKLETASQYLLVFKDPDELILDLLNLAGLNILIVIL